MGSWACTIGGELLDGIGGMANGNYLIQYSSSPMADKRIYHIPGVDGSLVTKMGDLGLTINVKFRIIAATTNAWQDEYNRIRGAWDLDNCPMTAQDPGGNEVTRVYLEPGTMRVVLQPQATGCTANQCWGDCEVTFTSYDQIESS